MPPKKGLLRPTAKTTEQRQEAPASIHERPGFAEGIVEAAERLLAGKPDKDVRRLALLAEMEAWHDAGAAGNEEGQEAVRNGGQACHLDASVAKEAKFYLLRTAACWPPTTSIRLVSAAAGGSEEALADETLEARHVRIERTRN